MAGRRKIVTALISILSIISLAYYLPTGSPEMITAILRLAEYLYSEYLSYQPYSALATFLLIAVAVTLTVTRRVISSKKAGYFYAPKGKIEIGKEEIGRLDLILTLDTRGDTMEKLINRVLEALPADRSQIPLWIKHSKETLGLYYILNKQRQVHELILLGKKTLLREFLTQLTRRLDIYSEEGRLSIVKSEPPIRNWTDSITPVKDTRTLPANIKLKEESLFGWVWRTILISTVAVAVIYLVKRLLSRKLDRNKAINIASAHLESVHGVKPVLTMVYEEENSYVVNFQTHIVSIDKSSGNILRVVKT